VALPVFARRTPMLQQSIDMSCPSMGPQQHTRSSGFAAVLWAHAGTDGLTDRRAGSANNAAFVIVVRQVAALAAQNVTKYTMIETLKTNTKLLRLLRNVSAHPTDEASGIMFSNCPHFCARVQYEWKFVLLLRTHLIEIIIVHV